MSPVTAADLDDGRYYTILQPHIPLTTTPTTPYQPNICIRLHLHSMSYDVRPFLTIAKPSIQGKMCLQYTKPLRQASPLRPPHQPQLLLPLERLLHAHLRRPRGGWEDLTRCLHFREYHKSMSFRRILGMTLGSRRSGRDTGALMSGL